MNNDDGLPFSLDTVPRHIAIVMDGNGRWAESRGKHRILGHRAGVDSVRAVVECCGEWGIEVLTLYAFSSENWSRPKDEVSALMTLLKLYLNREVKDLMENNVRLRAIGDLSRLPDAALHELNLAIEKTAKNTGLTLVLALSYGARDEILRAVRTLCDKVAAGEVMANEIDEATLAAHLDTAGLPDPDLMIRTAGEVRLSNFLLWQASYAEYVALPMCWPDVRRAEISSAIAEYQSRKRTFGLVPGRE